MKSCLLLVACVANLACVLAGPLDKGSPGQAERFAECDQKLSNFCLRSISFKPFEEFEAKLLEASNGKPLHTLDNRVYELTHLKVPKECQSLADTVRRGISTECKSVRDHEINQFVAKIFKADSVLNRYVGTAVMCTSILQAQIYPKNLVPT